MAITLIDIRNLEIEGDVDDSFIKCTASGGRIVLIWGSAQGGFRNFNAVRHQNLPVTIDVAFLEDCGINQENENRAYWFLQLGAALSIEEGNQITVLVDL